jgi:AcrR family transcriptional regulator
MPKTGSKALNPRKTPLQPRAQQTVDAILEATARILVKHGWARTNTNRVAEVAGVSIGTLYQYFPNKESLVVALNQRHAQRAHDLLKEQIDRSAGKPLDEAIAGMIRASVELHMENPELQRMLETELSYLDPPPFDGSEDESSFLALSRAFLEARRSEIAPRNLDLANVVVCHTAFSLVHALLFHAGDEIALDQRVQSICDVVMGYLTYRPGARGAAGKKPRVQPIAARPRRRRPA